MQIDWSKSVVDAKADSRLNGPGSQNSLLTSNWQSILSISKKNGSSCLEACLFKWSFLLKTVPQTGHGYLATKGWWRAFQWREKLKKVPVITELHPTTGQIFFGCVDLVPKTGSSGEIKKYFSYIYFYWDSSR